MSCTCGQPANLDRPDLLGYCDETCRDWAVFSAFASAAIRQGEPS